jgi:WD40 repeat protein
MSEVNFPSLSSFPGHSTHSPRSTDPRNSHRQQQQQHTSSLLRRPSFQATTYSSPPPSVPPRPSVAEVGAAVAAVSSSDLADTKHQDGSRPVPPLRPRRASQMQYQTQSPVNRFNTMSIFSNDDENGTTRKGASSAVQFKRNSFLRTASLRAGDVGEFELLDGLYNKKTDYRQAKLYMAHHKNLVHIMFEAHSDDHADEVESHHDGDTNGITSTIDAGADGNADGGGLLKGGLTRNPLFLQPSTRRVIKNPAATNTGDAMNNDDATIASTVLGSGDVRTSALFTRDGLHVLVGYGTCVYINDAPTSRTVAKIDVCDIFYADVDKTEQTSIRSWLGGAFRKRSDADRPRSKNRTKRNNRSSGDGLEMQRVGDNRRLRFSDEESEYDDIASDNDNDGYQQQHTFNDADDDQDFGENKDTIAIGPPAHNGGDIRIESIALAPDDEHIAIATNNGVVSIWFWDRWSPDPGVARTPTFCRILREPRLKANSHRILPAAAAALPESEIEWPPERDVRAIISTPHHSEAITVLCFSEDQRFLATGSNDKYVKVWEFGTGKLLQVLRDARTRAAVDWDNPVIGGVPTDSKSAADAQDEDANDGSDTDVAELLGDDSVGAGAGGSNLPIEYSHSRRAQDSKSANASANASTSAAHALSARRAYTHLDDVHAVKFSPDNTQIVTAGADMKAKVWDVETGQLVFRLAGDSSKTGTTHDGEVLFADYSRDGTRIITSASNGEIGVWSTWNGRPMTHMGTMKHDADVFMAMFSPDAHIIASVSLDNLLKIWDATSGMLLHSCVHGNAVYTASFCETGQFVATACRDNTVQVWCTTSGRLVKKLGGVESVFAAQFCPVQAAGKNARASNIRSPHEMYRNQQILHEQRRLQSVRSGASFIGGPSSFDRTATAGERNKGSTDAATDFDAIADWNGFGTLISVSRRDVVLWSVEQNIKRHQRLLGSSLDSVASYRRVWHTDPLSDKVILPWNMSAPGTAAHVHPDDAIGKQFPNLAELRQSSMAVHAAKVATGARSRDFHKRRHERRIENHEARRYQVQQAVFSPDGTIVASGSSEGYITVWYADSGRLLAILPREDENEEVTVNYIDFCPDPSRKILAVAYDSNKKAALWDLSQKKPIMIPFLRDEADDEVHPRLLMANHGRGDADDANAGDADSDDESNAGHSATTHSSPVELVTFSKCGKYVLTVGSEDKRLKVWQVLYDPLQVTWLATFSTSGKVFSASFWSYTHDGVINSVDKDGCLWVAWAGEDTDVSVAAVQLIDFRPEQGTMMDQTQADIFSPTDALGHNNHGSGVALDRPDLGHPIHVIDEHHEHHDSDTHHADDAQSTAARHSDTAVSESNHNGNDNAAAAAAAAAATAQTDAELMNNPMMQRYFHPEHVQQQRHATAHMTVLDAKTDLQLDDHDYSHQLVSAAAIMHSLRGHDDEVRYIEFSSNGMWLASASNDRSVFLWHKPCQYADKPTGQRLVHRNVVSSLCFSPYSESSQTLSLTTGTWDGELRIYRIDAIVGAASQPHAKGAHEKFINDVRYSPDGKRVLSVSDDHYLRVWDAESGVLLHELQHEHSVLTAHFMPQNATSMVDISSSAAASTIKFTTSGLGAGNTEDSFASNTLQRILSVSNKSLHMWDIGRTPSYHELKAMLESSTGVGSSDNYERIDYFIRRYPAIVYKFDPSMPYLHTILHEACANAIHPVVARIMKSPYANPLSAGFVARNRNDWITTLHKTLDINDVQITAPFVGLTPVDLAIQMFSPECLRHLIRHFEQVPPPYRHLLMRHIPAYSNRGHVTVITDGDDNADANGDSNIVGSNPSLMKRLQSKLPGVGALGAKKKARRRAGRRIGITEYVTPFTFLAYNQPELLTEEILSKDSLTMTTVSRWYPQAGVKSSIRIRDDDPAVEPPIRKGSVSFLGEPTMFKAEKPSEGAEGMEVRHEVSLLPGLTEYYGPAKQFKQNGHPIAALALLGLKDALGTTVVRHVLDFKWEAYAKYFFNWWFYTYCMFLLSFTLATLLPPNNSYTAKWTSYVRLAIDCAVAVLTLVFVGIELYELIVNGLKSYLSDVWNYFDMAAYSLIFISVPYHWSNDPFANELHSVVALVLWMKLLYFARGFRTLGPFVRMIVRIIGGIGAFMVVLLVFVLGFSHAFYLLWRDIIIIGDDVDVTAEYYSQWWVLLTSWFFTLGDFNAMEDIAGLPSPWLSLTFFVIFTVVVVLILLNLLIALMGDIYQKIQDDVDNEWLVERARIVLEVETMMYRRRPDVDTQYSLFPEWLHILRETREDRSAGVQLQQSLSSLDSKINGTNGALDRVQQELISMQAENRARLKSLERAIGNSRQ